MSDWRAWALAWGDSWGDSWGPLHEVEAPPVPRRATGGSAASRFGTDRTRPRQVNTEDDEWLLMAGAL